MLVRRNINVTNVMVDIIFPLIFVSQRGDLQPSSLQSGGTPVELQLPLATSASLSNNENNVLIQTATANISNLSSNSQRTYITESLTKRLILSTLKNELIIIETF